MWQRFLYVVAGLGMTIAARCAGIDLGLFLFFYFAKSYFLLNRQITLMLCWGMSIPWLVSEYFAELAQLPALPASSSTSLNMLLSAVYAGASVFSLMCCAMVLADEKSRYQISELSEQVESLATSLERTRIAREIHDSLGHTLTDLDRALIGLVEQLGQSAGIEVKWQIDLPQFSVYRTHLRSF